LPPEPRRIILDEDMNWKLARELCQRGFRDATSVRGLGLANQNVKDGALIKGLAEHHEPCLLVAWDNKMYRNHRQELDHFALTLAVIDKYADRGGLNEEEYYRDVIHREVHRMAAQLLSSIYIYSRGPRREIKPGVRP